MNLIDNGKLMCSVYRANYSVIQHKESQEGRSIAASRARSRRPTNKEITTVSSLLHRACLFLLTISGPNVTICTF